MISFYSGLQTKDIEIGALYMPHKDCKPYCFAFDCRGITKEELQGVMHFEEFYILNPIDIYDRILMLIDIVNFNNDTCFKLLCENEIVCLPYREFMPMMKKIS